MAALPCRLIAHSLSAHLDQLYTGLTMLARQGVIELRQHCVHRTVGYEDHSPHLRGAGHAHLTVIVGDQRLHFDTHDSMEVAAHEARRSDFYFKRSFSPDYVARLPAELRDKIRPLGLNYHVLADGADSFGLRRALALGDSLKHKLSAARRALDGGNRLEFEPRVGAMSAAPDVAAVPRILFLVAAYDPYDDPTRTADKAAERELNNETRAQCIRLLRAEFGDAFVGGFTSGVYAARRYPDLIVTGDVSTKANYLATLRSFPICVATTGLHGSVGWKFAEYIAFAKGIIAEQPRFEAPGSVVDGQHYLRFESAEQCVIRARELMTDSALRAHLMTCNAKYYQRYLSPDALMLRALMHADTSAGAT